MDGRGLLDTSTRVATHPQMTAAATRTLGHWAGISGVAKSGRCSHSCWVNMTQYPRGDRWDAGLCPMGWRTLEVVVET